jgi:hypothetical protein
MTIQTIDLDDLANVTGGNLTLTPRPDSSPPKTFGDSAASAAGSAWNGIKNVGSQMKEGASKLVSPITDGLGYLNRMGSPH